MTPLKQYPIKFNDTVLFRPEKWSEQRSKIMTKNTSESGQDLLLIKRKGKLSVSCQFACTSVWLATFQEFDAMDSFTLQKYDAQVDGYKSYTVRIENFSSDAVVDADYITQSTGLYMVSFDLIEF